MAAQVVADSGIFLALVLDEPFTRQAEELVREWDRLGIQVTAPVLFQYELVAVVRKYVHRGVLTPAEGTSRRDRLLEMARHLTFVVDEALLKRAFALAEQYNRPTAYDSQYLALAERLGCPFWTTDERLYNALRHDFRWIRWLGSIPDSPTG